MDRRSKHLSSEDRGVIRAEHDRGTSQRAIGVILVYRRWSPEQIAHRLRLMKPDEPSARVRFLE